MAPKNATPAQSLPEMIAAAVAAAMAAQSPQAQSAPVKTAPVATEPTRAVPEVALAADGTLTVRLKLDPPRMSSTGKMLLCAATGWQPTKIKLPNGKTLRVTLSAGCYAQEK